MATAKMGYKDGQNVKILLKIAQPNS